MNPIHSIPSLLGLLLLGTSANAQTTCGGSTGPDVIVGHIQDIANYPSNGSYEALSLGTTSCNLGDTWLNWYASINQHPVIGGTLYRFRHNGTYSSFDQLGQSWLKHGFYALSENLCCTSCNSTDGTHLGVGCSDPYTAGRNGDQAGLGPRSQVNPHTGAYPYPPANPGWSGSTARRLQVPISELSTSNGSTVRYVGECMYVTPDDSAAGNNNNNASWREVTVFGSGTAWSFTLNGSTRREQPALRAWKSFDPNVTLSEVAIPGDGHVIIGYAVTALPSGNYHYEYVVYNMNADAGIGSVSIPLPATAVLWNVGFHDIDFLNGDGIGNVNQSGADWPMSRGPANLAWACETFAANPNGNAIRWSSSYSFRFDTNTAPVADVATLGLFKTGGTISVPIQAPGSVALAYGFCFGDGSGTACPCGNHTSPETESGCANSFGTGGQLSSTGTPSVSADTFRLIGNGMPDSSALYFQGTTQVGGGAGDVFGDGKRCAGGSVIRLGTRVNSLGSSFYPDGGDPAISVTGLVFVGDSRTYQCWYRNSASFCSVDTFNLTNALQATWAP